MAWRGWMALACLVAGLGVVLGAFGSHALKDRLGAYELGVFETAVRYQMYHAFALVAVAFMASHSERPLVRAAGLCFVVGVIVFSGSLYTLVATGQRWLGALTPLGGLAFISGWLCLGLAALL